MHINPKTTGPIRPEPASPVNGTDRSSDVRPVAAGASVTGRSDQVEISDAGRALAARDGSTASALDPATVGRIRARILSGAYDTLEVVDAVARRLLDSGDL